MKQFMTRCVVTSASSDGAVIESGTCDYGEKNLKLGEINAGVGNGYFWLSLW